MRRSVQFNYTELVVLLVYVQTSYILSDSKQYVLIKKDKTGDQKSRTNICMRNIQRNIQKKRVFPGQKHNIVFA